MLAAAVFVGAWLSYLLLKTRREELEAFQAAQRREHEAVDRLRDQMSLPSLVNLNGLVLDRYHAIATEQATSSFRSSRRAMWCGFAWLLVCFGSVLFLPAANGAQLLVGSLAVAGGALSAFLSRTYIRVYERALGQLNQYFEQPLLNSYLLSAERVIGQMVNGKDAAYGAVLYRLLEAGGSVQGKIAPAIAPDVPAEGGSSAESAPAGPAA